jgi:hypothetical protein
MVLKFSCYSGINVACRKVERIHARKREEFLIIMKTKSLIHMELKNAFHFIILLFFSSKGIMSFGELI